MKRSAFIIGMKGGLINGIIAVLISWKYPFLRPAFILMFVLVPAGAIYGARYLRTKTVNEKWLQLLFWSNVITWLVPFIGFFTSGATRTINLVNHGSDRKIYMRLAYIALILSFINAALLVKYVL